jgi:hypothetical protein
MPQLELRVDHTRIPEDPEHFPLLAAWVRLVHLNLREPGLLVRPVP